jgi:hypothetical protein
MCRREKVGRGTDCVDRDPRLLVRVPAADAAGQNTKGEGTILFGRKKTETKINGAGFTEIATRADEGWSASVRVGRRRVHQPRTGRRRAGRVAALRQEVGNPQGQNQAGYKHI